MPNSKNRGGRNQDTGSRENSKQRKGDTSRTSSQGRKYSTGGDINKKGNREIDEQTKRDRAARFTEDEWRE